MNPAMFCYFIQRPTIERLASRRSLSESGRFLSTSAFVGGLIWGICTSIEAQTAHFAGVETTFAQGGVSAPGQVAIDAAGDLFVADTGNNRIVKESPANGGYLQSVVDASGFSNPLGIAVDSGGNLYVADSGKSRIVKETLSGDSYTATTLPISGLNNPVSIAVDSSGNLYVSDVGNSRVLKETLVGSNYTQSTILTGIQAGEVAVDAGGDALYLAVPASGEVLAVSTTAEGAQTQVAGGLSNNIGVAVDLAGVVYIADAGNRRLLRVFLTGNYNVETTILETVLPSPDYLAIDGNDTLYFGDSGGAALHALAMSGYNFGTVAIGAVSGKATLLFSFDSGGTISAPSLVLQGISGMDFADAGTGSCTTNGSPHLYFTEDSCTVDVTFSPQAAGWRNGAALLFNAGGVAIATAYVRGWGDGPQLNYPPGSGRSYGLPGGTSANIVVADAAGNLYINHAVAAFDTGNAVYKETWTGNGFAQSLVATNLAYPLNIALDGAGNVYVLDEGVYDIFRFSRNADGSYTNTTFDQEQPNASALAVDGAGNVYFANSDNTSIGSIQIDMPQGGYFGNRQISVASRTNSIVVDGNLNIYFDPYGAGNMGELEREEGNYSSPIDLQNTNTDWLAIDGMGNIYTLLGSDLLEKLTLSDGSFQQSVLDRVTSGFSSLTVDGSGNIYWLGSNTGTLQTFSFANPPALHFAATQPGSTSSDSPQALTIFNAGSEPLRFPAPSSGANPALPEGFAISGTGNPACPDLNVGSSAPGVLAPGASCQYEVGYTPLNSSDTSGWMTITDDNLNQSSPFATQSIALAVAGYPLTPTVSWSVPSNIVYGTALSAVQLDAVASVPGAFIYTPGPGAVLGAGTHVLSTSFTPGDKVAFSSVKASVQITVTQAAPTISWSQPAAITYGTALSSTQLTASTPVAGTFTYTPAAGTVLTAGSQTLSVTFTPTDTADYTTATATVTLTVNQATPSINWSMPAAITYGTALTTTQLNASSPVAGAFSYSPTAGTVLSAGWQTLTVTFTPTDSVDYTQAIANVTLTVNQATPTITWTPPAAITYGTALSAMQLNASSTLAGTFRYSPVAGAVLKAGPETLTVTFFPIDSVDYRQATVSVTLTVNQARPTITWATPKAIPYGSKLGSAELDAKATNPVNGASIAGVFDYSPPAGTVLAVGTHTLAVTFIPTDTTDYTNSREKTLLTVTKARQTIDFTVPKTPLVYGAKPRALSANATSKLKVTISVISGPGKMAEGILTITGAGTIEIAAHQAGDEDYEAATEVIHTVVVDKARLTVSAGNLTMKKGSTVPPLTYKMSGFVDNDRQKSATTGEPKLTTTATSTSKPGYYPIDVTAGTLAAKNYSFKYDNGQLTVVP